MKYLFQLSVSDNDRRSGVALIMVLGVLAILLVLAGAFVVTMRTERQAARNSIDGVRARMLLPVAIGQAVKQLNTTLYGADPMYSSQNVIAAAGTVAAAGYDVDKLYNDISGIAEQYIPEVLGSTVEAEVANADWVTITNAGGDAIGRFTYVAADCSGFLDANYSIGDPSDPSNVREVGRFPEEMMLHDGTYGLSDLNPVLTDPQLTLFNSLLDVERFENYEEFEFYAGGLQPTGPKNFFTFSRYQVADPVVGQYVRVFNPDRAPDAQDFLHLLELEVYSGCCNVALSGTASSSTTAYDAGFYCDTGLPAVNVPGNVIDGCLSTFHHSNNTTSPGEWVEVDLGSEVRIDEIVVYERFNSNFRLRNYSVIVYDSGGSVVWESTGNNPPHPGGGGSYSPIATPVMLEGDETELAERQTDIIDGLTAMGLSVNEAEIAFNGLMNYVDDGKIPEDYLSGTAILDPDMPSTESVPMFNEFWHETTVTGVGSNFIFDIVVDAELFYPFVTTTTDKYSAEIGGVSATITVWDAATNNSVSASLGPVAYSGTASGTDKAFATNEYYTVNNVLSGTLTVPLGPIVFSNNAVDVVINLIGAEVHDASGTPVDRLADGIIVSNRLENVQLSNIISQSSECLDPRFNYNLTNDWNMTAAESLDAINAWTTSDLLRTTNSFPATDGDTAMYVKSDELQVVGELGYLPIAPWQTIKLYNNGNGIYYPVHEYFTMKTYATVSGLVNPNTDREEVLAAVFHDMPIDQYPGEVVANWVNWAQAGVIANDIKDRQNFVSVSDVIADDANYVQIAFPGISNELQRESLFRNAADLLGTRNNVLTLLLLVQVGDDRDGDNFIGDDEVNGTEKAVVVIWRDPYPDASGLHPYFVHQLHRLY